MSPPSPRVRPATPDDLDDVARLESTCLGRDAWSHALVAQGIAGTLPTVSYLVAELDDVVVGHAVTSVAGDVAELQRIAVDPAHRRRGIAAALLEVVVETARQAAADRLLLEVREDNAGALALYDAAGFAEIDRRRRYYADGATAVVMLLPL